MHFRQNLPKKMKPKYHLKSDNHPLSLDSPELTTFNAPAAILICFVLLGRGYRWGLELRVKSPNFVLLSDKIVEK